MSSAFRREYDLALFNNEWIDNDGVHHEISKMGMQHIHNCIKMCEAKPGWRDEWLPLLKKEFESRRIINY